MRATSVVERASAAGVTLEPEGERIRFEPEGAMTPELARELRENREDVLRVLRGEAPEDNPLVDAVARKLGGKVESVESRYGRGGWTRSRVAETLARWRRIDGEQARRLRETWSERLVVCGGEPDISDNDAERVAWADVEREEQRITQRMETTKWRDSQRRQTAHGVSPGEQTGERTPSIWGE